MDTHLMTALVIVGTISVASSIFRDKEHKQFTQFQNGMLLLAVVAVYQVVKLLHS